MRNSSLELAGKLSSIHSSSQQNNREDDHDGVEEHQVESQADLSNKIVEQDENRS